MTTTENMRRVTWYIWIWLSLSLESTGAEHNKTPREKNAAIHSIVNSEEAKDEDNLAVKADFAYFFDIFIVIISHHCHYRVCKNDFARVESKLVGSAITIAASAKSTSIPPNKNRTHKLWFVLYFWYVNVLFRSDKTFSFLLLK